jgi:YegS/Rv2252/BmrU family lipid kinase
MLKQYLVNNLIDHLTLKQNNEKYLVINPYAGNGKGKKFAKLISKSPLIEDIQVFSPVTLEEAKSIYTDLNRDNISLFIAGGDGTFNSLINLVQPPYRFEVSLIPTGSGNDLARYYKLGSNPYENLRTALHSTEKKSLDIWEAVLTFDDGTVESKKFINTFGIGFDAYVGTLKEKKFFLTGISVYLVSVLQALFSFSPVTFVLETKEGKSYNGKAMFITSGNGTYSGGGFKLTPNAVIDDGILEICVVDNMSLPKILVNLPKAITGSHINVKEVNVFNTCGYTLSLDSPAHIHLDGETSQKLVSSVKVSLSPHRLNIIY